MRSYFPVKDLAKRNNAPWWNVPFSQPLTYSLRRHTEFFANAYLGHAITNFFFGLFVHRGFPVSSDCGWRISLKTLGSNKNKTNSSTEL
jgi:hypothetical protein